MQKSISFRIYPNEEQKEFLAKSFGCKRFVYNHLLAKNIENIRLHKLGLLSDKPNCSGYYLSSLLVSLKQEFVWLNEISAVVLQQTAIDLGSAFQHFFKGKGFPKFKSKFNIQTIRLNTNSFRIKENKLMIGNCKTPIKVNWHLQLSSPPSSVTITKECNGNYHAAFVCEVDPKLTNGSGMIGIDLGLKDFATFSNGDKIANPKFLQKSEKKLKKLQRSLSKKQKGSSNRNKARLKVAKLHSKIRNQKNDFLHKLSRKLVNENQVIAIESLNIKGMLKNHKLAKAISSVSWNRFIGFLRYKTIESNWCILVEMDRWFASTQTCSFCEYKNSGKDKLKLKQRLWVCPSCNTSHDRDTNAAQNILNEAMRMVNQNIEYFRGKVVKMELESI
jgi:putative transposase